MPQERENDKAYKNSDTTKEKTWAEVTVGEKKQSRNQGYHLYYRFSSSPSRVVGLLYH